MILLVRSFISLIDYRHKDCTSLTTVKEKSGGMVKHVLRLAGKAIRKGIIS
jgi:hypothetical protein